MARSILAAPTWLIGVLLVVVLPGIVLLAQWGVRRRWPVLVRGEHNDVIGFIIAVVGVLYAVLLAFVVIIAWERRGEAEHVVGLEASALRSIYRDSVALPRDTRTELQHLVVEYATEVTEVEWPVMAEGQPGSPPVADTFDAMAVTISRTEVETPAQQEFVGAEAERLSELVSLRSERLDFVEHGIPGVLWIALVLGGIVTIGFAVLFGVERAALHLVMVGSLAALIGVLLFVTVVINFPFSGGVAVDPGPFERVLADFGAVGPPEGGAD